MKGDIEVLRVLRQPPMGKLVVQTGTGRFAALSEVQNDELRRRILAAIGDLLVFAGGYDTVAQAGFAPPLNPPPAPPAEIEAEEESDLTPQQAAFISQLENKRDDVRSSLDSPLPPPGQGNRLLGRLRRTAEPRAKIDSAPGQPLSITDQINRVLQEQLKNDMALAGRTIKLTQAPSGSLQIVVDDKTYERPTEIPDPQVQRAIRRALKTWETGAARS